jgi:hypothetical protein
MIFFLIGIFAITIGGIIVSLRHWQVIQNQSESKEQQK